jgi:hypothetical protein
MLYYYECIKLSHKRHKPFRSYGDTSLQAKTLPRISIYGKKGHNYAKQAIIIVLQAIHKSNTG